MFTVSFDNEERTPGAKARIIRGACGTAEAVPFHEAPNNPVLFRKAVAFYERLHTRTFRKTK
jgi:hypothetical protein